jgi:hypothetical protein
VAIKITIQNKIIDFPSSSASPNWAPAIIEFAKAVETALSAVVGGYDVAPQVFNIDTQDTMVSADNLPNCSFPPTAVKSFTLFYAVSRSSSTATKAVAGFITAVYNSSNPSDNKWEVSQEKVGEGNVTFSVTDLGKVQYITESIGGADHTGDITYRATAILTA